MEFRLFIENEEHPNLMHWVRQFFTQRMDHGILAVAADNIEEGGDTSELPKMLRLIAPAKQHQGHKRRINKGRVGNFTDRYFHKMFWDIYYKNNLQFSYHQAFVAIATGYPDTFKNEIVIRPDQTAYRLTPSGKWSYFHNPQPDRTALWMLDGSNWSGTNVYPITWSIFAPITVDRVPDNVLLITFSYLMMKLAGG